MNSFGCLFSLELADAKSGAARNYATEHLAGCPRCAGLYANAEATFEGGERSPDVFQVPMEFRRQAVETPDNFDVGQLWAVELPGAPGWREVVLIVDTPVDTTENPAITVAPTHDSFDNLAEGELVFDESPIGYPFVLALWASSPLLIDQLDAYVGSIDGEATERVLELQSRAASADWAREELNGRPPIVSQQDERILFRDLWEESISNLWAPYLSNAAAMPAEAAQTIGEHLSAIVAGDEWDTPTLATAAGITIPALKNVLNDTLDLTDQGDVDDLGRLITVVKLDDWRESVAKSLERSPGGERIADDGPTAIAARSFASVPKSQRDSDLHRNQGKVDDSAAGRSRAIDAYLNSLEKRLDDSR